MRLSLETKHKAHLNGRVVQLDRTVLLNRVPKRLDESLVERGRDYNIVRDVNACAESVLQVAVVARVDSESFQVSLCQT